MDFNMVNIGTFHGAETDQKPLWFYRHAPRALFRIAEGLSFVSCLSSSI